MRLSSSSCFKEKEAKRNRCCLFNKAILVHCQIQIIRLWSLYFPPVNNLLPWPPLCWPGGFVHFAAVLSLRSLNLCIHTGQTINRSCTRWTSKEHFMCRKRCGSSWSQRGNCEEIPVQPAATVLCRACVTWQQSVCVCLGGYLFSPMPPIWARTAALSTLLEFSWCDSLHLHDTPVNELLPQSDSNWTSEITKLWRV